MGPDHTPLDAAFVPQHALHKARATRLAGAIAAKTAQLALVWAAVWCAPACKGRAPKAVHVPQMAQGFDASAIAADSLSQEAAARHHVLNMGVPELCHRAQSFALRVQTTVAMAQDGKPISQRTHTAVFVQDAVGSTHLQTGNAEHQLELIAVGDKAFVRQDRGHLRRKRRQEVDEVEMAEAAVSAVRELLQHFAGATLVRGTPVTLEGREAVRYEVQLEEDPQSDLTPQPSLALLPVAAPSRWREEAKHPRLDGKITVDTATGVVLKADITGVLAVTGATGQSVNLTLRAVHTLTELGAVAAVKEPRDSIDEIRRPVRPKDPLNFFRAAQKAHEQATAQKLKSAEPEPSGDDPEGLGPPSEELPE